MVVLSHAAQFSLTGWEWHPDLVVGLLIFQGLYLLGIGPLRERFRLASTVELRQVGAFSLGVIIFLFAESSSLHELSENYLFSAHMLQHLLLTLVVPPLLILGTPGWLLRPVLSFGPVLRVGRVVTFPLVAFGMFNAVFALWHLPVFYEATLEIHAVHIVEHLTMMSTAVIMWWPILSPLPELPRLAPLPQMVYLFLLPVAQLIIFGPITFASGVIYPFYGAAPRVWDLSALADQQIGGVIMKVGSMVVFFTVISIVFYRWFSRGEDEVRSNSDSPE